MKPVALRLPKGNLKNKMIGSMGLVFDNEQKEEQMLMQISIKKFPKDFGDTVTFEIKTNLPDGEKIEVYIYDSDSNFSNGPNAENDTNLYKANYTLGKIRIVSIAFTKAMQELAFKDVEGDSAECYIKIKNAKITDAFSEVFNVDKGANTTNLEKLATNPLSNYTPDWMKLKKDAEKTPKITFTDNEMIWVTATVIGETGQGALSLEQQIAVGWVYYNRIGRENNNVIKGLNGSFAFNRSGPSDLPNIWVMTYMVALGDLTYQNESSEGQLGTKTISELAKTNYMQPFIQKAKLLKPALISAFNDYLRNPYPDYTGQGFHGDLNLERVESFRIARAYYWLQRDKKVSNDYEHTYVIELRTNGQEYQTTFIFKEKKIEYYFKKYSDEIKKIIPFYNWKNRDKSDKIIYR